MPSVYPSSLDSFPTSRTDSTVSATNHALDHDNAFDALNKIEAELGINPRGGSATVKARLDAITAALVTTFRVNSVPVGSPRAQLNLIPGAGITIGGTDDGTEIDVTIAAVAVSTIIVEASTARTLALTDADAVIQCTSSGTVTLTVPPAASVAFPTGTAIQVARWGSGEVAVVGGAGVTVQSPGAALRLNTQYSGALLLKMPTTNEWWFEGDIKV